MLLYDRNIIGPSSETFGNLRQSSENIRKMFGDFRLAFGTILENHQKSSECVENRVEREKIKLLSTRGQVISSISQFNTDETLKHLISLSFS